MHFKLAYIKLTVYYVSIIMLLSIMFSGVIYKIASFELGSGLNKQTRTLREEAFSAPMPGPLQNLDKIRSEQLAESSGRLKNNLIYFNLLIFVLASAGSYFLARRTLRPIEDTMKSQSRFTADASHELRTPLAAMRSEIEVALRNNKLSLSEAKGQLKSNIEEIEKLEILSAALLKLARFDERNHHELDKVDMSEAVVEAYSKLEKLAYEKQINFNNKLSPSIVMGDKGSLTELCVILIDNAIKYSPAKTTISIKTSTAGRYGILRIRDNGVGIKSSHLPHIFDRFYRADNSRAKINVDGYGLGLSIAKSIVDMNHGKIFAESTEGKGSVFTVKIPLWRK